MKNGKTLKRIIYAFICIVLLVVYVLPAAVFADELERAPESPGVSPIETAENAEPEYPDPDISVPAESDPAESLKENA